MDQLQTCYAQHFGEQLPLAQYMSLYDSWQASSSKRLPTQPEPTADPPTVVLETTAGSQKQHSASCIKNKYCIAIYSLKQIRVAMSFHNSTGCFERA